MHQAATPLAVEARPLSNASDLLLHRLAEAPDAALFAIPEPSGWREVSVREFHRQVVELAKGFVAAGVEPGDKIGMLCTTRYEWTVVDFAAWFAGAILVPIYDTSSPAQIRFDLGDSGAQWLMTETEDHAVRFAEVRAELPDIRGHWRMDQGALAALVSAGAEVGDDEIERRRRLAVGADTATIIYTSGSTGVPKGCVLTHSNFVELTRNAALVMPEIVAEGASTVLFITIAHVFARFISVLCVYTGVKVGHQADTSQLLPALQSFKPSFLLAVPRVFEKVYNSAEQNAESGGRGAIFRMAAATAVAHSMARDRGRVPIGLKLRFAVFDRLVYAKLREAMGGRIRYAISGSAPLGLRLGHFFRAIGVQVMEGYGLTETTAPATVNIVGKEKIGTVGPPLPGVAIRIADDGEVQVKGIDVFAEYWNNEEATAAAFDGEWFLTGDLGSLDRDGYLTITGRKKEIIVTAGGKNVAPASLEDRIRADPLVSQVVVVGEQRPFIAALVTLDEDMLPVWLQNHGENPKLGLEAAAMNPKVLDEVQHAIDRANAGVSRAESIRKFTVLATQFTERSGHLTPKLSIKRAQILHDFADEIEALYGVGTDATTREVPVAR